MPMVLGLKKRLELLRSKPELREKLWEISTALQKGLIERGFDIGVTVEGGLPIPITTPAHGTAYDIVGKGIAKITAMENAFELACRMGESSLKD